MVRIALIRVSDASDQRLMAKFFRGRDGASLRLIVRIVDSSAVRILKHIVSDRASLRATFRLWLNENVWHKYLHESMAIIGFPQF